MEAEERKTSGDASFLSGSESVTSYFGIPSIHHASGTSLAPASPPPRSALATSTLRLETPLRLYFSLPFALSLVSSSVLLGSPLFCHVLLRQEPRYFPADSHNAVIHLSTLGAREKETSKITLNVTRVNRKVANKR